MVHYSVDTNPRKMPMFVLAALALGLSIALSSWAPLANHRFASLSALSLFGILLWVFDNYIWRWLPGIPDLSGRWTGKLTKPACAGAGNDLTHDVTIMIRQTWSRMDVVLEGQTGISRAQTAGLLLTNPDQMTLCWSYYRRPKDGGVGASEALSEGYAQVLVTIEGATVSMNGYYFSIKNRGGTIRAVRA